MNAITTINPAPTAAAHGAGHSIFSHRRQAEFLSHLATFGNVRLACRAARVSAQTAYRARRGSAAFARAWDASLLAARDHAEQVLADRAVNGWEEAVFYHGEEVARRRRYSDRLLLAHLARLDRMAEREELVEALPHLDAAIDALREGEALPDQLAPDAGEGCSHGSAEEKPLDRVPGVPSCRSCSPSSSNAVGHSNYAACESCGGKCDDPDAELTEADCQWFGNRVQRFYDARPDDAPSFHELAGGVLDRGDVEMAQMEAFEAGASEWWLVTGEGEDDAAARDAARDGVG